MSLGNVLVNRMQFMSLLSFLPHVDGPITLFKIWNDLREWLESLQEMDLRAACYLGEILRWLAAGCFVFGVFSYFFFFMPLHNDFGLDSMSIQLRPLWLNPDFQH